MEAALFFFGLGHGVLTVLHTDSMSGGW